MLDVLDFITERGGDPEKIRESQRKRHAPVEAVDEVIALFQDHKKAQYEATRIGSEINATQKEIGQKAKNKENADDLMRKKDELTARKKATEALAAEKQAALLDKVKTIGNYVAPDVPVSDNEENNGIVKTWSPSGAAPEKKDCLSHDDIFFRLQAADRKRGVKITGHRGYCLTGYGFFLNQALINYGTQFLFEKGFSPNQPPYVMSAEFMAKTAQLSQFDEELYGVVDGEEKKYLIATSEQPLSALHAGEWLQEEDLPILYAGSSTCFRREAGSHGKNAMGLFRVHQFEKVEQFVMCKADQSWEWFDKMLANSEEFYQSLGLPYRVVAIVSGALNNAAAKKCDLEAWFPFHGDYKELVSCSNCTDYQTRELEIRFGANKQKDTPDSARKEHVHALNATLCATQRTLCCILENFQTTDGVNVPEVLRRFIPGQPAFLPFVRELPPKKKTSKGKGNA